MGGEKSPLIFSIERDKSENAVEIKTETKTCKGANSMKNFVVVARLRKSDRGLAESHHWRHDGVASGF